MSSGIAADFQVSVRSFTCRRPGGYSSASWPGLEPVLGDAAVPLPERDPQLTPREVRSEAPVHAAAERDVRVVLAVEADVERIVVRPTGPCWRRRSSPSPRCPSSTCAPVGRSTGHWAIRGTPVGTGDSQRSSSSTATGMIDGSSTIIWRCSGCVARNAYEQVSVSLTVSSPAMRKRKQMSRISSLRELLAVDLGGDEARDDVGGRRASCARRSGSRSTRRSPGRPPSSRLHARVGVDERVLRPTSPDAGFRRACAGTCASRLPGAPSGRGTPTTGTARRTPR